MILLASGMNACLGNAVTTYFHTFKTHDRGLSTYRSRYFPIQHRRNTDIQTGRERERERERQRQRQRETDRHIDRQTDRQTDGRTGRQAGRRTDRQTDRQADRQTDRQRLCEDYP